MKVIFLDKLYLPGDNGEKTVSILWQVFRMAFKGSYWFKNMEEKIKGVMTSSIKDLFPCKCLYPKVRNFHCSRKLPRNGKGHPGQLRYSHILCMVSEFSFGVFHSFI